MRSGRMRHLITIQQRTETRDALGGSVWAWSTLATVWAEVRMAGTQERYVSSVDQDVATITHRVKIRYRSDVGPLDRIQHDGRTLDIESAVDPDGRRAELVMMCREVVDSG